MRKRDRDRLAERLTAMAESIYQMPTQQLHGASWYFANNAEIKGFDSAHAARTWLEKHATDLRVILRAADPTTARRRRR